MSEPRLWVMVSDRPGDAKQAFEIADATGIPYEVKSAIPYMGSIRHKVPPVFAPEQLDPERSSRMEPPWPALVLAVGAWPAAASLWVRKSSGGQLPIALIGRPKPGLLQCFDVIVAYPYHRIPDHPAVVRMTAPPLRPDPEKLRRESEKWKPKLEKLSRPLTAVLVGGPTKPFRLDRSAATNLAAGLRDLLRRDGGSLYVATSLRSPAHVIEILRKELTERAELFDWHKDDRADNPYLGLLGCADRFVVTSDSVSMLVEVSSLHRPLAIFELPRERSAKGLLAGMKGRIAGGELGPGSLLGRLILEAHDARLMGFPRDLRVFHRSLYARGLASRFGSGSFATSPAELDDELKVVGDRIRGLLGGARRGCDRAG